MKVHPSFNPRSPGNKRSLEPGAERQVAVGSSRSSHRTDQLSTGCAAESRALRRLERQLGSRLRADVPEALGIHNTPEDALAAERLQRAVNFGAQVHRGRPVDEEGPAVGNGRELPSGHGSLTIRLEQP